MFQVNQYAIKDKKVFAVKPEDSRRLNESGHDIYWTPNNFTEFGVRKKEFLKKITGFYCEIDGGDKKAQIEKLKNHLVPSCMIETGNGYHVYWYLNNTIECTQDPLAKADWFRNIVVNRICTALDADTNAADACRLLRLPFYRYWKDGKGSRVIDIVFESERTYTLEQILSAFPERKAVEIKNFTAEKRNLVTGGNDSFWEAANRIPVVEGLQRLSGTDAVGMQKIELKKQGRVLRIFCDGKATNAWVDKNGLIGSLDGGGPAIPNWIFWYHKDWKKTSDLLKKYFEELSK